MLSQKIDWLLQCCGSDSDPPEADGPSQPWIELNATNGDGLQRLHSITRADSFDITFTPRPVDPPGGVPKQAPFTPRQKELRERVQLPQLHKYPAPPELPGDATDEAKMDALLKSYQDFALDLHAGMYLTQLTSNRDYSEIHCQLMDDLQTLKLDQSNGRIIEFPLTGVSKVYRIVKNDDKWYSAGSLTGSSPVPPLPLSNAEHIVVVEFMRRKLAFVFREMVHAQRFLMCMELLIRRAQQRTGTQKPAGGRALSPALGAASCKTPRQV